MSVLAPIPGPVPPVLSARETADRIARRYGLEPLTILHTQRHLADPARDDGHDEDGIAGDCSRAAFATLLGCGWNRVPHAAHYPDGYDPDTDLLSAEHGILYHRRIRRWLREYRGFDIGWWDWTPHPRGRPRFYKDGHPWSGWVLSSGPSPRGPFDHVIVAAYHWRPSYRGGGRLVPDLAPAHDPHPSRAGLAEVTSVGLLIDPYDPPPPPFEDDVDAEDGP